MIMKIGKSIAFCILASIILVFVLSIIAVLTPLSEEKLPIIMLMILIFTSLAVGITSSKGEQNRGWLRGISAGAVYAVLMILLGVIISTVSVEHIHIVRNIIIILICSCVGGTIGINLRSR